MSTQRQITLTHAPVCRCGYPPKAYKTIADIGNIDGPENTFHLECYRCQYITPKLHDLARAIIFFSRIIEVVALDATLHKNGNKQWGTK